MTTIQDRIIKDFIDRFGETKLISRPDGTTQEKTFIPREQEQFIIQSIKLVQEETRKEVVEECKQKMAQSNEWWNKKLLSITNKDKQK